MITVHSTTADNHESTLCTGTNDMGDDTGAHTNLYSCHIQGAFGLFGNSINTANITANISDSNCDHKSYAKDKLISNCDHKSCVEDKVLSNCDHKSSVEDELLSNCDTKESVDHETNSNCDTCLGEDESVRLSGKNSNSFDTASHDHIYQPYCLEDT